MKRLGNSQITRAETLLALGVAIGVCVAAAWAMVGAHSHDTAISRPEFESLRQDVREIREEVRWLRNHLTSAPLEARMDEE